MQKYMQKKRIFPACLFLMFVLMILVIGKETDMTGRGETQKIRNLSDGWYYLKEGERTEVTLPTTLQEDPAYVAHNPSPAFHPVRILWCLRL